MPRRTGNDKKPRKKTRKDDEMQVKKMSRYLEGVKDIDINDHDFLRKFVTEHGKIIPARMTGATAKQQRQIKAGVRRARTMGLIP
jgi:small subunit ribosomal protein S18